jgi:hypothetical protein
MRGCDLNASEGDWLRGIEWIQLTQDWDGCSCGYSDEPSGSGATELVRYL